MIQLNLAIFQENKATDETFIMKNVSTNDYFIRKMRCIDNECSIDTNSFVMLEDTLDVCKYRIIERYAVNRMNTSNTVDVWGMFFVDKSAVEFKMEDTLNVCNYRKFEMPCNNQKKGMTATAKTTNQSILPEQSVVVDYHMKNVGQIDDSMDICSYRQIFKTKNFTAKPKTPVRSNATAAKYINKTVFPRILFNASPMREFGPTSTSSPIVQQNRRR